MVFIDITLYYIVVSVVPLYFAIYALQRIILHKRDGREAGSEAIQWQQNVKRGLIFLLILANIYLLSSAQLDNIDEDWFIVRSVYYTLNIVCWIMSLALLTFEFYRRLQISWWGQRTFWPLEFFLNGIWCGLQIAQVQTNSRDSDYNVAVSKVWIFGLTTVLCFILAVFAIVKPDDFYACNTDMNSSVMKQFLPRSSSINVDRDRYTSTVYDVLLPKIRIEMDDYRLKSQGLDSVVIYTILIFINGKRQQAIKRTYEQMEKLEVSDVKIEGSPELPKFAVNTPIDDRMKLLVKFYNQKVKPDQITEYMLDFLEIGGFDKQTILAASKHLTSQLDNYQGSQDDTLSRADSIQAGYYNPDYVYTYIDPPMESFFESDNTKLKMTYFEVTATQWNDRKEFISYEFKIKGQGIDFVIQKRYKDFYRLHERLKKVLKPAKPPELPAKNSVTKVLKGSDTAFIENRQNLLEFYLICLLNDPAYQTSEVFEFVNIKVNIVDLWQGSQKFEYKLNQPLAWKTVQEQAHHFQLYKLTIGKYDENDFLVSGWTTKRRYREFNEFYRHLETRFQSPILKDFYSCVGIPLTFNFPSLPRKSLAPLTSHDEVNTRKEGLEELIRAIFAIPCIGESVVFRKFINDMGY